MAASFLFLLPLLGPTPLRMGFERLVLFFYDLQLFLNLLSDDQHMVLHLFHHIVHDFRDVHHEYQMVG